MRSKSLTLGAIPSNTQASPHILRALKLAGSRWAAREESESIRAGWSRCLKQVALYRNN